MIICRFHYRAGYIYLTNLSGNLIFSAVIFYTYVRFEVFIVLLKIII
jgi:hypothetical protein